MVTHKATVRIKGKSPVAFEYTRPETWAEVDAAYDEALSKGLISDMVTKVMLFNYGLDLKIRAKIQTANTNIGQLTVNRERTKLWILSQPAGEDFRADLIALMAPMAPLTFDAKLLNAYLDDLYAEEAGQING